MNTSFKASNLSRRSAGIHRRLAEPIGLDLLKSLLLDPRHRVPLAGAEVSIEQGHSVQLPLLDKCAPASGLS